VLLGISPSVTLAVTSMMHYGICLAIILVHGTGWSLLVDD